MATSIAVLALLKHYGVDPEVLTIVQIWLGGVLGIGTLDSIAEKSAALTVFESTEDKA